MIRLRNVLTGVVVSVSDETAARLGQGWDSVELEPEPAKRGPGRPKKSE